MRARGLKLLEERKYRLAKQVAPHAGAWIETSILPEVVVFSASRPMRARGLKQ